MDLAVIWQSIIANGRLEGRFNAIFVIFSPTVDHREILGHMIVDSRHTLRNLIGSDRLGPDLVLGIFQEWGFEIHLILFLLWQQLFVRDVFFDSLGFNFNLVSSFIFLGAEIDGFIILFVTFQRIFFYGVVPVLVWPFECHISRFIFLEPI